MRPKKIILISIDTLRADHLGCYGYKRDTSPNMDRLAKEGILFKYAFSPAPHTIPAHGSIFTSKYPNHHSIGFNQTALEETGKLNSDIDITMAEVLSSNHYKTAAFVSGIVLRKDTNFNIGFEIYDDEIGADLYGRRDCLKTNKRVFDWLEKNYNQDFFLFIHYFDVHGPYICPEPYNNLFVNDDINVPPEIVMDIFDLEPKINSIPRYILNSITDNNTTEMDARRYKAQYDSCIRFVDDSIEKLIEKLKQLKIYEDSLIIITSDHGEAFGENNIFFYHGLSVTLDQIAVPLILKPHRDWDIKSGVIDTPVSTIDIMPTVLSLSDYDYSSTGLEGHSLKNILENKEEPILKERMLISENERQFALIRPKGLMEIRKKDTPSSTYYPNIPSLIDSLNGKKYCWNSGNEYVLTIPFDQYQRYKIIADIINKFRKNKKTFKIIDIGAGFEGTLKKFLPHDDIYFMDKDYPPEYKLKNNYMVGDITTFKLDGTYDFVVSTDTYEHILPVSRESFVNKLIEFSKIATIIAAPFDTNGVKEHEIFANEVYKISHGIEYKWLYEHIHNGLPSLPYTLELIKKSGFDFTVIPNGYLPRWFEMISIYFLTEGITEFSKSMEELHEFYNKNFYCYDNLNPAYRQVIVINKNGKNPSFSDIYHKNALKNPEFAIKAETLESFFKKIKELCSDYRFKELIEKTKQVIELNSTLQVKNAKVTELASTLQIREAHITELTKFLQVRESQVKEFTGALKDRDTQIIALNTTVQTMQQSIVWQGLMKFQGLIEYVLPPESLRRRYYDAVLLRMRGVPDQETNHKQKNEIIIAKYANTKIKNMDILCFPIIDWNFRYQRPQQLLSRFAKNGYRVFYLTAELSNTGRPYIVKEIEKNVLEIKLSISSKFNVHKNILTKKQINSVLNSLNAVKRDFNIDEAVCFVDFPNWEPVVSKLKEIHGWKMIYDCMDEHTGFSNINASVADEETKLFEKSDLIVVTSNHLLKKAKNYKQKLVLIPNAGDFEHFNKLPENDLLANIRKPIIGYYGAIAEWFDDELIDFLSRNRPDWNFVLIGHTFGSDLKKFDKIQNVHFLEEKPYSELPGYLYWFDVCIIPFKLTPLIQATHPVKFYEYLSSGKPVVSSELPELVPYQELCYIAQNKEEFLEKIEMALKESDLNIKNKRIEFAKNNTWDTRYQTLISHIEQFTKVS